MTDRSDFNETWLFEEPETILIGGADNPLPFSIIKFAHSLEFTISFFIEKLIAKLINRSSLINNSIHIVVIS